VIIRSIRVIRVLRLIQQRFPFLLSTIEIQTQSITVEIPKDAWVVTPFYTLYKLATSNCKFHLSVRVVA